MDAAVWLEIIQMATNIAAALVSPDQKGTVDAISIAEQIVQKVMQQHLAETGQPMDLTKLQTVPEDPAS